MYMANIRIKKSVKELSFKYPSTLIEKELFYNVKDD